MFFKKSASQELASPLSRPPGAEAERALETVASLIRTYGRHALDLDTRPASELREECDEWAARIIVGSLPEEDPVAPGRRDFGGLLRFFEGARSSETTFVSRSQASLRDALQQFASCLGYALAADRKADGSLDEQLATLSAALDTNDPERIRVNADRVLKAARLTMLERRNREMRQVEVLAEKFNQLKTELLEARTQATTDNLTQLYNRNALDQHLERISDWGVLFRHSPALLLIDLDHFKEVNDTYGHAVGDAVLRALGDVLTRSFLRRQDFVARYGGEEFAVVAVETPEDTLRTMADRLLDAVRKMPVQHAGTKVEVTVSIGFARLVQGERPEGWLERADKALYEAKRRGRDRMVSAA